MSDFSKVFFKFAVFCLCYCLFSIFIFLTTRDGLAEHLASITLWLDRSVSRVMLGTLIFCALTAIRWSLRRDIDLIQTLLAICFCAVGATAMHLGFNLFKTSIPLLVPFFADPALAQLDAFLHGGYDPWVWTWDVGDKLDLGRWLILYFFPWILLAGLFPLILTVADKDTARVSRHLKVYLFCWIFLGGVVAVALSSVGPVFYDRLLDATYFEGLIDRMDDFGFAETPIGQSQEFIWTAYLQNEQELGTGVSSFPSVHVAVATLFALYAWERSMPLFVLSVLYWIVIMYLSVWTGFHYAIDGYFSGILVWAYWYYLTVTEQSQKAPEPLQTPSLDM